MCGGDLIHSPTQGMLNLRDSGPSPVRFLKISTHEVCAAPPGLCCSPVMKTFFLVPFVLSLCTSAFAISVTAPQVAVNCIWVPCSFFSFFSFFFVYLLNKMNPFLLVLSHVTYGSPLAIGGGCLCSLSSLSVFLLILSAKTGHNIPVRVF